MTPTAQAGQAVEAARGSARRAGSRHRGATATRIERGRSSPAAEPTLRTIGRPARRRRRRSRRRTRSPAASANSSAPSSAARRAPCRETRRAAASRATPLQRRRREGRRRLPPTTRPLSCRCARASPRPGAAPAPRSSSTSPSSTTRRPPLPMRTSPPEVPPTPPRICAILPDPRCGCNAARLPSRQGLGQAQISFEKVGKFLPGKSRASDSSVDVVQNIGGEIRPCGASVE